MTDGRSNPAQAWRAFGIGVLIEFCRRGGVWHPPKDTVDESKRIWPTRWTTWGEVYDHHRELGRDHSDAAYRADEWERRKARQE